jgi:hypothetical protein
LGLSLICTLGGGVLSTATVAPEDALSIFTVQDEKGQVDATVPVRWCISRETAEMLQKREIKDPQLVIVVEHDGEEMDRYIVPLEKEMRYIQFRRPGNNVIHATIMWSAGQGPVKKVLAKQRDSNNEYAVLLLGESRPRVEELEKQYDKLSLGLAERLDEGKEESDDEVTVLRARLEGVGTELNAAREKDPVEHHLRDDLEIVNCLDSEAELGVMVPDGMFAGKPPRWMSWLGKFYDGLFWKRDARDQCELRRRALITLPTLPLTFALMLLWIVGIELVNFSAVAVLLLFGMRNLNFSVLRKPFELFPADIWANMEPSVWWTKHDENADFRQDRYPLRHPALAVVNPPVVAIFGIIGLTLYLTIGPLLFLILGLGAAFALGLLILIINIAAKGPLARMAADYKVKSERLAKEEEKRNREAFQKELEQLSCTSASRDVSLSALPKERRTVALRFQALKVKVCRPFARA